MKNNIINPNTLKGVDVTNRQKALMGITETVKPKVQHNFELVKKGSDGNAYAIVKENSNYFIKKAVIKEGLKYSDFNYIGGLANKMDVVYESFSKATKQLNLRLIEMNETYGGEVENIFQNDVDLYEDDMYSANAEDYDQAGRGVEYGYNPELGGDDIDYLHNDEMSESDLAVDRMITGEFQDNSSDELEMDLDETPDYTMEGYADKVLESFNKLDKILQQDLKKKV